MWESPIYRFRIPKEENNESSELKEIVIDVTDSAPPFNEPSPNLKYVLKEVFNSYKEIQTVLEFGAAKLKNIPFILEQGKAVCAVDFEELTKNSITKKNIEKCRAHKSRYQELVFPNPFICDEKKFDLILLANVLPVMPIFAERMFALQLFYEKVKDKGFILWVAQKEGSYRDIRESGDYNCGDGVWRGERKYFKTFYKYHTIDDLDEMMFLSGFEFIKKFSVAGDDIRLYQKTEYNIFEGVIKPTDIPKSIPVDSTIENPKDIKPKIVKREKEIKDVIPNPPSLSLENFYREALEKIEFGHENEKYQRLVSQIIYRVFRGSLRNMAINQDMDGLKKIDTVYSNIADKGFFANLSRSFQIKCPYIIVEAKNYSFDPENREFDQIGGRLKDNIGKFGILVCRKIENIGAAKQRCEGYLDDGGKHIIFLTDSDLLNLLELYKDSDTDGINDFMDKKLRPLVFKTKK